MFRLLPLLLVFFLPASFHAQEKPTAWIKLFDGKSLAGWKATNFGGEAEVEVRDGAMVLELGEPMTGVTYTGKDLPAMNYELIVEARKLAGNDFFCTTTFPVGKDHCSLVLGGWGGTVVGLSTVDGKDASENATRKQINFERGRWYQIKIRVTPEKIQAWIDNEAVVDLPTAGRKISIRPECDLCRPLGLASWRTRGAIREVKIRGL